MTHNTNLHNIREDYRCTMNYIPTEN